MKKDTVKLVESINESEETGIYCDTLEELKSEVEKQGGLYGFIAEKYYTMPITLLKEIALNAVYELNDDTKVINDLAERIYNEGE